MLPSGIEALYRGDSTMTNTSMGAPQVAKAEIRIDDVLRRSYEILEKNFSTFAVLAAIASLPFLIVGLQFAGQTKEEIQGHLFGLFIVGVLAFVVSSLGYIAIIDAGFRIAQGRPAPVGESLQRSFRRLPALIGLTVCLGIPLVIGFVLFVIPGLFVLTIFSVAMQACVVESLGPIDSMERSFLLTKGHRWKIFGIMALIGIAGVVASAVLAAVAKLGGAVAHDVIAVVWNVLFGAFCDIVVVVLYRDLRMIKEGGVSLSVPASPN